MCPIVVRTFSDQPYFVLRYMSMRVVMTYLLSVPHDISCTGKTPSKGKIPAVKEVERQQSYEESMGMGKSVEDTLEAEVDTGVMDIERLDAVNCYLSHDWSVDELQR